jgi:hypothetical protein
MKGRATAAGAAAAGADMSKVVKLSTARPWHWQMQRHRIASKL